MEQVPPTSAPLESMGVFKKTFSRKVSEEDFNDNNNNNNSDKDEMAPSPSQERGLCSHRFFFTLSLNCKK